jgi:hypothetical protein
MRNLRRINLPRPLARAAVALAAGLALLTILPACGGEEQPADRGGLGVTRLVTVTTTDPMSLPGKQLAATTDTVTLWLGPGVARRDVGGGSLLLHAGVDRLTWLDHRARTWTSQTADEVREQVAALAADSSAVGLAGDEMDRLKSLLRVAVSAKDTGEEREIAGYRCRRWVVEQRDLADPRRGRGLRPAQPAGPSHAGRPARRRRGAGRVVAHGRRAGAVDGHHDGDEPPGAHRDTAGVGGQDGGGPGNVHAAGGVPGRGALSRRARGVSYSPAHPVEWKTGWKGSPIE